jgi:hypothetical protein
MRNEEKGAGLGDVLDAAAALVNCKHDHQTQIRGTVVVLCLDCGATLTDKWERSVFLSRLAEVLNGSVLNLRDNGEPPIEESLSKAVLDIPVAIRELKDASGIAAMEALAKANNRLAEALQDYIEKNWHAVG